MKLWIFFAENQIQPNVYIVTSIFIIKIHSLQQRSDPFSQYRLCSLNSSPFIQFFVEICWFRVYLCHAPSKFSLSIHLPQHHFGRFRLEFVGIFSSSAVSIGIDQFCSKLADYEFIWIVWNLYTEISPIFLTKSESEKRYMLNFLLQEFWTKKWVKWLTQLL